MIIINYYAQCPCHISLKNASLSEEQEGLDARLSQTTSPGSVRSTGYATENIEDHFVILFGGLHIEMAVLRTLGDHLGSSGWTGALVQAGVATSGTADSFLNAAHAARTTESLQPRSRCLVC